MHLLIMFAILSVVTGDYVPGKAFDRFVTIWLENEDFTTSANNSQMKDLASQGILLSEYYGVTHPSQPNYIASVGGDYFGLNHDGTVRIPRNVSTIVDLLDTQFIDWRGYFEDIPGPGYMGPATKLPDGKNLDYVRKHNPFVSYDSINYNGSRLAKVLSFREFDRDVKANTLPQYMHISPNMLNDGHDTSSAFGINWTSSFLKPLLSNPAFMNRTLILLTYDESRTMNKPNQITSILLGGAIPIDLRGTVDNTLYTHYSILSTIENNWDLPCLGRYDVGANVFTFVASQTKYVNKSPGDLFVVKNSHSYPGYLHKSFHKSIPIPPPNLMLNGAGGKGVEKMIQNTWQSVVKNKTPYDGSGMIYDGESVLPVYRPQAPNLDLKEAAKGSSGA